MALVPGNHEVHQKRPVKMARRSNEKLWRDNTGDLVLNVPLFTSLVGRAPGNF